MDAEDEMTGDEEDDIEDGAEVQSPKHFAIQVLCGSHHAAFLNACLHDPTAVSALLGGGLGFLLFVSSCSSPFCCCGALLRPHFS